MPMSMHCKYIFFNCSLKFLYNRNTKIYNLKKKNDLNSSTVNYKIAWYTLICSTFTSQNMFLTFHFVVVVGTYCLLFARVSYLTTYIYIFYALFPLLIKYEKVSPMIPSDDTALDV